MPATLVDKLLPTITWTLVHSLWQGLILTVLAGFVLLLTRRTTAALRYAVLCSLFFLYLGGVCLTFLIEWNGEMDAAQKYMVAEQASSFPIFSIEHWRTAAANFLNQNTHWIVLAWTLVLLFQSGRMLREMVYVRELRNRRTWTAETFWRAKVKALAEELGIRKTVLLAESAVVKVPIVMGHFKPLVMVPVGMLNHLSPGEMEAVLLHELAHIRRHDYLVNYVQRIAETFLFFNPGMLWVSSLLRTEREACCDEMAIARTGNKLQFVEALIRCKEHALQTPGFSLGLFGNRNLLLQRLNRIVSNRNKSLSLFETSFLGISILVLMLILSGWNERATSTTTIAPAPVAIRNHPGREMVAQILEQHPKKEINQITTSDKPAVPLGKRTTQLKKQQTREVVSNINIDQRIPDLTNDPVLQIAVPLDDLLATKQDAEREEAEKWRAQADWSRMQAEIARHQAKIDRAKAEVHRKQANEERELANQHREQAQIDRLRADRDRIEVQKLREQANRRWQPEVVQ